MSVVDVEAELLSGNDLRCEAQVPAVLKMIDQWIAVFPVENVGRHGKVDPLGGFHAGSRSNVVDLVGRLTGVGIARSVGVGGFPIQRVQIYVEPEGG